MGIWTRKSVEEIIAQAEAAPQKLRRILGGGDLVMLGIGAVIGAGLFSLTGIAAAENAGPAIVIAFLISALGCLFSGLCYCELAGMIPVAGSAYTYAYATMGELIAWLMGWNLILEFALGAATVSISWSAYFISILRDLGIELPIEIAASPWQPVHLPGGSFGYGWINLPAVLIVMAISLLLITGIKQTSLVNIAIVSLKLAAIVAFIALGFFYINWENYHPFIPPNSGEYGNFGWSGVLRGAGVLFFAYVGFDAVSTAVQETKLPQRNIPIGILGSLGICALLYVAFGFIMTGLVNYKELKVAAPVAGALTHIPFKWIGWMINMAILAGLTSVILVMLLGQSRIFYAMARDGLLPPWFAEIHPRFYTPWLSNLTLMVFVGAIGGFAPLSAVSRITSIGTLLAFTIVCCGVLILRYTHPEFPRPFKTPFSPLLPCLGVIVCLTMMLSLDADAWWRLLGWLGLGGGIYWVYSHPHAFKKR